MPKKSKVFLDTSAILAGLNSPSGAAGVILAACFSKEITAIISPQVIEEANKNIPLKFPELTTAWQSFLLIPPKVTLVTWNTRHFLAKPVMDAVTFPIQTPGDFLHKFLKKK